MIRIDKTKECGEESGRVQDGRINKDAENWHQCTVPGTDGRDTAFDGPDLICEDA